MTPAKSLLCVANFPAGTGYAWQSIERLFAFLADELETVGVRTWVAYPEITEAPTTLEGSSATAIEMDLDLSSVAGIGRAWRDVRRLGVTALYLTDGTTWHPGYAILRLAGVRTVIVHDRTSGERERPRGLRGVLKRVTRRIRPALADIVLAVSTYVGRRKVEVDLVPPDRVVVVHNSVPPVSGVDPALLATHLGLERDRPIVVCACRAAAYKGVQHLFRAFDALEGRLDGPSPILAFFGDGDYLHELERLKAELGAGDRIVLAGYDPDVRRLIAGATVCVVPSVWAEAFGRAALEPALHGVPVIATRVGGLPEVVVDGETGLLVPPADPDALADALLRLLGDPELRREMGARARVRAEDLFSQRRQRDRLSALFRGALDVPGVETPAVDLRPPR